MNLSHPAFPCCVVVGIGSPHGDDAIGWRVLEELRSVRLPDCALVRARTPVDALDHLDNVAVLHLIDACYGTNAGTLHRWIWPSEDLIRYGWTTSHDVDLVGAIQLADQLNLLPPTTIVWGIESDAFQPATGISEPIQSGVMNLVSRLRAEIDPSTSV
jgi:hydrogenase maturation protease